MRIAALDIGGTSIKSGIWDGEELTELRETPTEAKLGGPHVMEQAIKLIHSYDSTGFDAVGISTAGQVNPEGGFIIYANENIPGYTGMQVRSILEEEFHVPVAVENDVNAAAIGEGIFGAGKGEDDFLCLTYGTGVGGAVVIHQKIYGGHHFSAGEFGGILTHPESIVPGQPFSGCYEKYASATALVERVTRIRPELVNGRLIFSHLEETDVKQAVDAWIDEIVHGLVTVIHIFNPSCIILGGGVMAQPYILEQVREKTTARIMDSFRDVKLTAAKLGNHAGILGAAYLASSRLSLY